MPTIPVATLKDPILRDAYAEIRRIDATANERIMFLKKQARTIEMQSKEEEQPHWRAMWERLRDMGALPADFVAFGQKGYALGVTCKGTDYDYGIVQVKCGDSEEDPRAQLLRLLGIQD